MPRVDIHLHSTASPETVRAALIDFSPRRPEIWPGISPEFYEVRSVGETWADVREGTRAPGGGAWAVEHYDWSDPQTVLWTVRESNFSVPGSSVSATITPGTQGGSDIHIIWNRTPSSFAGRIATLLIRATRGAPVASSFRKGLAVIERRDQTSALT